MHTKPGSRAARVPGVLSWQAWVVGATIAGLAATGCTPAPPPAAPKAPEVDVTQPVQEDVTDYAVFTGNAQAEKSVNLVAQVTGYLLPEPMPKEGTDVTKNQPLFKIDPRVYQAALDQAKADTATAEDVWKRDVASPIATPEANRQQDLDAYTKAKAVQQSASAQRRFHRHQGPVRRPHQPARHRPRQPRHGQRHHPGQHRLARPNLRLLRRGRADTLAHSQTRGRRRYSSGVHQGQEPSGQPLAVRRDGLHLHRGRREERCAAAEKSVVRRRPRDARGRSGQAAPPRFHQDRAEPGERSDRHPPHVGRVPQSRGAGGSKPESRAACSPPACSPASSCRSARRYRRSSSTRPASSATRAGRFSTSSARPTPTATARSAPTT